VASALDPRLPPPGTYLQDEYKGRQIIVKILVNGFGLRAYKANLWIGHIWIFITHLVAGFTMSSFLAGDDASSVRRVL
jgi:hypothetical protein